MARFGYLTVGKPGLAAEAAAPWEWVARLPMGLVARLPMGLWVPPGEGPMTLPGGRAVP